MSPAAIHLRSELSSPQKRHTYRRRPHRKSKTGCAECRKRRVKCSEEKPICQLCDRHSTPCIYPPTNVSASALPQAQDCREPSDLFTCSGSLGPFATSPSSESENCQVPGTSSIVAVGSRSRSSAEPVHPTSDPVSMHFSINDLALLHHWTLSTSLCILKSPDLNRYWQVVFPEIGFQYPFVMHGILSLAALHRASVHPEERQPLGLISARHYNEGLQGFREGIDHMCDKNGNALFAFASINILYVFAMYGPQSVNNTGHHSFMAQVSRILGTEWIPMIRGVGTVAHSVRNGVRLGRLRSLLDLGNWEELDPDHNKIAGDDQFCHLKDAWVGSRDTDIYDRTLYLLRRSHMYMAQFKTLNAATLKDWGYNREWSAPLIWLHAAPQEYFVKLNQRQPVALLIFAYFATLLHALDSCWCLKGWGKAIVTVVDDLLGNYWMPWTEWPRSIVSSS